MDTVTVLYYGRHTCARAAAEQQCRGSSAVGVRVGDGLYKPGSRRDKARTVRAVNSVSTEAAEALTSSSLRQGGLIVSVIYNEYINNNLRLLGCGFRVLRYFSGSGSGGSHLRELDYGPAPGQSTTPPLQASRHHRKLANPEHSTTNN